MPDRLRRVAEDRTCQLRAWTRADDAQCVPRDDVNNCGGCASDGSGHDCNTILAAAAVGCSRNGKCMACSWRHGGLRQRGDGDSLECAEAVMPAFVPPAERAAVDPSASLAMDDDEGDDGPQQPLGVGYIPRWGPGRIDADGAVGQARPGRSGEGYSDDAELLLEQADLEHQELLRLRAEVARYRAGVVPGSNSNADGAADRANRLKAAPDKAKAGKAGAADAKGAKGAKAVQDAKGGKGEKGGKDAKDAKDDDDPLFDDSTDTGDDPESVTLVPRWLRRQLRGRRFATTSDLHAFLAKLKYPPGDSDVLSGVLGQQALAMGIGKAAVLVQGEGKRKRTNAERFALDLPPLPPGNLQHANRRETTEQREKRMDRDERRARAEIAAELEMRAAGATDAEIAELQPVIIGANGPVTDVSPWKRAIKGATTRQLPKAARDALLTYVDTPDDEDEEEEEDDPVKPLLRADRPAPFAPVDRLVPAAAARGEVKRDVPKAAVPKPKGVAEPVRPRKKDDVQPIAADTPVEGYNDIIPDPFGGAEAVPRDADADAGDEEMDAAAESLRKLKDTLSPAQWRALLDEHAAPAAPY